MKKYLILVLCVALLLIGLAHQAAAKPEVPSASTSNQPLQLDQVSIRSNSASPGHVQANSQVSETSRPEIWFGLAVSLLGAVVFWCCVIWMARRRVF